MKRNYLKKYGMFAIGILCGLSSVAFAKWDPDMSKWADGERMGALFLGAVIGLVLNGINESKLLK